MQDLSDLLVGRAAALQLDRQGDVRADGELVKDCIPEK